MEGRWDTQGCRAQHARWRWCWCFVDSLDPATGIAHEAKTGFTRLSGFVQRQIDKDVVLLAQGRVNGLQWHFYPSSLSGSLGPSRGLLDELRRKGIEYVIHLP